MLTIRLGKHEIVFMVTLFILRTSIWQLAWTHHQNWVLVADSEEKRQKG